MKKISAILLTFFISLNLFGCTSSKANPHADADLVITDFVHNNSHSTKFLHSNFVKLYQERFNLKIKINTVRYENPDDILTEISTKGRTGELGDLLFLGAGSYNAEQNINNLLFKLHSSGATVDLKDKVENIDNLMPLFGRTNYLPLTARADIMPIHKDLIKKYNLTTKTFITNSEHLDMLKKIMNDKKITLSPYFFNKEIFYEKPDYYEVKNKEVSIDLTKLNKYIKRIENRLKSNFYKPNIFDEDFDFIADNYIKRGKYSHELNKKSRVDFQHDKKIDSPWREDNLFFTYLNNQVKISSLSENYDYKEGISIRRTFPVDDFDFKVNIDNNFGSMGFVLLKTAPNKPNALKFLDFCISDEGQLEIARDMLGFNRRQGPVSKNTLSLINSIVEEFNTASDNPIDTFSLSSKQIDLIETIFEKPNEELNTLISKDIDVVTNSLNTMLSEELYDVIVRKLFDKTYPESDFEREVNDIVRSINLKVQESL